MRSRIPLVALAAVAIAAALPMLASGRAGQEGSATASRVPGARPTSAAEYDQLFQQISNWGRWGKDDRRGTANLLTAAKRKQSAALVKVGLTVSLAHDVLTQKAEDNPQPWEHVMNPGYQADTYKVSYHGGAHSHIDALCHMPYNGLLYNGVASKDVNTAKGCTTMGIDGLKEGIFTRGVLIDVPRLKGVPYLEPGTAVYAEDIEAWEKKAGVKLGSGDAILLRTGRWLRRDQRGPWGRDAGSAGYHVSAVRLIKARDVAVVGHDSTQEVHPSGVEGIGSPVHVLLIAGLGAYVIDALDLEALAETAAKLHRWEFLLTVAPSPVRGGTGGPVNAQATF